MKHRIGRIYKRLLSICVAVGMICGVMPTIPVYAAGDIRIYIDGEYLETKVSPYTVDGYTVLPMREVYEAFGAEVYYEKSTHIIYVTKGNIDAEILVGEPIGYITGMPFQLTVTPFHDNSGRTMVGVRDAAVMLDAEIEWYSDRKIINICTVDENDDPMFFEDYEEDKYYENDWYESDIFDDDINQNVIPEESFSGDDINYDEVIVDDNWYYEM